MQVTCPNCRSTLNTEGSFQTGAPYVQALNCPVCGQEIWVNRGLIPLLYKPFTVIWKNPAWVTGGSTVPITQGVPTKIFEASFFEKYKLEIIIAGVIAAVLSVVIILKRK